MVTVREEVREEVPSSGLYTEGVGSRLDPTRWYLPVR